MASDQTIFWCIEAHAKQSPETIAFVAPERSPLTYNGLQLQIESVVQFLNQIGIGPNDPVAIVLPNGPELATAFLSVASAATCAPLNPSYGTDEFDFYLSDLKAKALLVQSDLDVAARTAAKAHDIPIIELAPALDAEAGLFELSSDDTGSHKPAGFTRSNDVAMALHTSGTTSRPKLVPLTQTNLCRSAENIRRTLALDSSDRCLNVMPLFHVHGLIGAVLASMMAGASVVCSPGFDPDRFFGWLRSFKPTWYTAVPTMHQAVIERAGSASGRLPRHSLRFVRSSSASLPPKVMVQLEQLFGVPVVEAYGMTEGAHQLSSNPLPPQPRKSGSVGLAQGLDVAILNQAGHRLPQGQIGEIAVRGPSLTRGYRENPAANRQAFSQGWFRTGDQGYLDADNYLFITGRIKEIINRGGEKVAPREVDEVFINHPAVRQATTFAAPHETLGEDVVTAVELHEEQAATAKELRDFAFGQLADFKVPSQVLIVDEIPKGPTGKLQRIGLANKLADRLQAGYSAPATPTEQALTDIWSEILALDRVGVEDNFFRIGGDSLRASQLIARIQAVFRLKLPIKATFRAPTIVEQAHLIEDILVRQIEALSEEEAKKLVEQSS